MKNNFIPILLLSISLVACNTTNNNKVTPTTEPAPKPSVIEPTEKAESPSPIEEETQQPNLLGKTTISFSTIQDEIYLKTEMDLNDAILEFPNSDLRTISKIYSYDDKYEPSEVVDGDFSNNQWINLLTLPIENTEEDKSILVDDRLFSFKKIPNTDNFLFVVELRRSGSMTATEWSPRVSERVLYLYDQEQTGNEVKKIAVLDDNSDQYSFPKIDSFDSSNKFVSFDAFGCWNCGGHQPEKLLLDLQAFDIENIGNVSDFVWGTNGNYKYKEYVVIDCDDPGPGECSEDPESLEFRTGSI